MFDFQQKRKIRAFFESRIVWVILLILASVMMVSAYGRYEIARDMAERRAAVEHEVEGLKERRANLEAEVQYLSNERGIEAEVRRQFDVALEGEQVVIIVDEPSAEVEPEPATTTPKKRAWYRFW